MKNNIKAALLSALVLPGLGQLYKGCKLKGVILISLVNIFLLIALAYVLKGASRILVVTGDTGKPDIAQVLADLQRETPKPDGFWEYFSSFGHMESLTRS